MGKGKKRGGQKGLGQGDSKDQEKVEAQTSELSLDDKTSTSAAAEPVPSASTEVPEEEEGLGLGGPRKKNKPRKKKSAAAAAAEPAAQPAAGSAPAQSVPPQAWPGTIPVQQPGPSQQSWSAPSPTVQGSQPRPVPAWSAGARQQSAPAGPAPAPWGGPAAPPGAQQPQPQQKPQSPPAAELIPSPSGSTKNFPISSSRGHGLAQPIEPKVTVEKPPYTRRKEVICRYRIPERVPGNQVLFTPIKVLTNYLPLVFKPMKIYRYDVSFTPERPKKFLPQAFKLVEKEYYAKEFIAFDQIKNCYSLHQLKNVPSEGRFFVNVDILDPNGKKLTFEVSLKFTGIVDLANLTRHMQMGSSSLSPASEEIQCIDVILRHGALESYVKCGRQFFKRPSNPVNLTGGLEMWTGLFQSAIFTSSGFINIDVAHKGFPIQQNLAAALENSFRLKPNCPLEEQRGDVENFRAFVKNLRVTARLLGTNQTREFICNDLVQPPDRTFFTVTRGDKERKISVLEYFAKEKNYRIQYPRLNCVWVGPRDKHIFYPMELLDVVYGQASSKQLTDMQLSTMVRQAATPPDERKRKIEECARAMNYSNNAFFKKFGLEISDKFFEVDAKVLQAPTIDIGDVRSEIPRNGVWQAKRLLKPESLIHWGFAAIDCDCRSSNFETIRALILSNGRQLGMQVAEPRLTKFQVRISELRSVLLKAVEERINFMFVIVSRYGRDIYHRVKQIAETDVGILTQCIKENTAANKMNPQTIRNILLKVNSKLMGVNQSLDTRSLPRCMQGGGVMIIGADVTHPSPDQSNIPSIAAVTASLDPKCFMYNIELSIQTPKKEMIVQFEDMILDHLKVYRKRNGQLPKKMYIFRDGVSEGQFAEVMNSELAAVHSAYAKLVLNVKPEVMFLLVQKRHHTRLFLGSKNSANVAPGTVVDTHIVHPKELDFYLVSHHAIKGTARPTRYHSVCNDGRVPDDEVEQLAYYLCHLYARCPRAVSYPTPTYYAHLACLRARSLTYGHQFDNKQLETQPQRLRVLDKMLEFSRMFFV